MPSSAVFFDCYGGNITSSYVYNNIIWLPGNNDFGIFGGPDSGGPTTGTLDNCVVANNVFAGSGAGSITMEWAGPGQGVAFTPGRFFVCNNVFYNGGTPSYSLNSGGQQVIADNSTGVSSSDFVNASAGNFHLTSGATDLIGKGTNLSSFFTVDAGGYSRQGLPAVWDIGAYANGSVGSGGSGSGGSSGSGGNTNPAILISSTSLDFGTVLANVASNLTVTVQNTSGGVLTGSASVSAPFSIISGGNYSLGSNQTQTVTIGFNPTTAGVFSQTVTFSGGNGASVSVTGLAYGIQNNQIINSSAGTIVSPFTVTGISPITVNGVGLPITISSYISQAAQTGLSGSGEAVYGFGITNAGKYVIFASVNAPGDSANSFYINLDSQPTDPAMVWDPPVTSGFTNLLVSWRGSGSDTNNQYIPAVFNLAAGTHQLIVRGREAGAQLAALAILPLPSPPIGVKITTSSP